MDVCVPVQVDVELARQIAGRELRDEEMQKKLWLKVAQHVIKKEKNIEKYIVCMYSTCTRIMQMFIQAGVVGNLPPKDSSPQRKNSLYMYFILSLFT